MNLKKKVSVLRDNSAIHKVTHFYNGKYNNSQLDSVMISDGIFIDENCDLDRKYSEFDTVLWLPDSEIIRQTPSEQNLTGMVVCFKSIENIYQAIMDTLTEDEMDELSSSGYKKLSEKVKFKVVKLLQLLCMNGFVVSISLPSYLFDHCNDKIKVNSVNYALINSLLKIVFIEKRKASIETINIHIMNRGSNNNGFDSRISKLARKALLSDVIVNRKFLDIDNCKKNKVLNRVIGLSCWFVNQEQNIINSKWLELVKAS